MKSPALDLILAPLLASIIFKSHKDHAFVEGVGARPGEGPTGAFAFGRARGGRRRGRSCRRWPPCDVRDELFVHVKDEAARKRA